MRLRDRDLKRVRELAKGYAPAYIRQQLEQAEIKNKAGAKFGTSLYGGPVSPPMSLRKESGGHFRQDPWEYSSLNVINMPSYTSPSTTYRPLTSGRTYESSYGSYGSALYEHYDSSCDNGFKSHSWYGNNIRQRKSPHVVARRGPKSTPLWKTLMCLPFTIIKLAFALFCLIVKISVLLSVIIAFLYVIFNVKLN